MLLFVCFVVVHDGHITIQERESEIERERECVCVCVREREIESYGKLTFKD